VEVTHQQILGEELVNPEVATLSNLQSAGFKGVVEKKNVSRVREIGTQNICGPC
jgi:hypothetical protein